ncbi:hypothetical protein ASE75_00270 [Sphingomonas sp. Leaf17]|nr:hypothetical protein ASE75_00270 [Sphingomonas sp. Leaf17]
MWLITLTDLALLLVGFLVLIQATRNSDGDALAQGIRAGFGSRAPQEEAMPVAAAGMMNFAPGSSMLPAAPDALVAWAHEVTRDPRVLLTVTGSSDGTAQDVDPTSGNGAVLAADRARTVAAVLATRGAVSPGRMVITTDTRPGRSAATVTLAFAGTPSPDARP